MNVEKEVKLNLAYQAFMDLMLKDFPVDRMPEFVLNEAMGYGTTLHERLFGIEALGDLIEMQREQSRGINMSWDIQPVYRWNSSQEDSAIFVDEVTLRMKPGDQEMEISLRLSLVFEYHNEAWKLVHWHGSKPEYDESGEDTWHLGEWQKKNEELQRMVDEKTADLEMKNRELEIESSLERVRTVAMGMRKPDDMLEVCRIISQQSESLGIKEIRNVQTAIIYEDKGTYLNYEYYAKHDKLLVTEVDYKNHELQSLFANRMLQGAEELFAPALTGKEVKDWYEYQKTTNQFADSYLENAQSLNYYFYSLGPVALGISTYAPLSEEEISLFKRFRNVFDLAYRRFLDIEQAEAQAREAKIEASLERVRAQALSMRKPDDLPGICEVLFTELTTLGFSEIRNAMINIHDDEKASFVNYDYSDEIGQSINHLAIQYSSFN